MLRSLVRGRMSISGLLRTLFGVLVVVLLLVLVALFWPAAQWLPKVLPDDMRVEGVSGSLIKGAGDRLYWRGQPLGPWSWRLTGADQIDLRLGTLGQGEWNMRLGGWPPAWWLEVSGGDLLWAQNGQLGLLQGRFTGQLSLSGNTDGCTASSGELQTSNAAVAFPPMTLGSARFRLDCEDEYPVRLDLVRRGEHELAFQLDLQAARGLVKGELVPGSSLARLGSDFGLLAPNQRKVDQPLAW